MAHTGSFPIPPKNKCRNCGAENPAQAKQCRHCHARIK